MGSEQTSVHSTVIESIDDLRTPIASADIEITQLGPGRVQGHLTRASIGDVAFSMGSFSTSLRAAGVFDQTHTIVGVLLGSTDVVTDGGVEIRPGDVVWTPPAGDHDVRYAGQASFVGLSIRPREIAGLLAGENWLGDWTTWEHSARCRPQSRRNLALGRELANVACRLHKLGTGAPDSATDFWKRSVVEAFAAGILDTIPESADLIPSPSRLVREVEHYVDTHNSKPVHISEICSVLKLSRRTLHRAFHDVTGFGPAAFLRRKRLCHVYSKLNSSDPLRTHVTQVATEFGFTELGRFSQYYRALFDEYPSETLRRGRPPE